MCLCPSPQFRAELADKERRQREKAEAHMYVSIRVSGVYGTMSVLCVMARNVRHVSCRLCYGCLLAMQSLSCYMVCVTSAFSPVCTAWGLLVCVLVPEDNH